MQFSDLICYSRSIIGKTCGTIQSTSLAVASHAKRLYTVALERMQKGNGRQNSVAFWGSQFFAFFSPRAMPSPGQGMHVTSFQNRLATGVDRSIFRVTPATLMFLCVCIEGLLFRARVWVAHLLNRKLDQVMALYCCCRPLIAQPPHIKIIVPHKSRHWHHSALM